MHAGPNMSNFSVIRTYFTYFLVYSSATSSISGHILLITQRHGVFLSVFRCFGVSSFYQVSFSFRNLLVTFLGPEEKRKHGKLLRNLTRLKLMIPLCWIRLRSWRRVFERKMKVERLPGVNASLLGISYGSVR